MMLWGFWVLATLLDPTRSPGYLVPEYLVLGLAVVAAALLVVAATTLPTPARAAAPGVRAFARRARTASRSRLVDPDAAGHARPRAPGLRPAAA